MLQLGSLGCLPPPRRSPSGLSPEYAVFNMDSGEAPPAVLPQLEHEVVTEGIVYSATGPGHVCPVRCAALPPSPRGGRGENITAKANLAVVLSAVNVS